MKKVCEAILSPRKEAMADKSNLLSVLHRDVGIHRAAIHLPRIGGRQLMQEDTNENALGWKRHLATITTGMAARQALVALLDRKAGRQDLVEFTLVAASVWSTTHFSWCCDEADRGSGSSSPLPTSPSAWHKKSHRAGSAQLPTTVLHHLTKIY